jgi:MFS family permease
VGGFKWPYMCLTLLQGLAIIVHHNVASGGHMPKAAMLGVLMCLGGQFSMAPAYTFQAFGENGAAVYSLLFTAFGLAGLLGPTIGTILLEKGGHHLYGALALLSVFSSALAILL